VTDTAATNKAEETSKTRSVETDSTLSSEAQSKVGDEPSVDASKQISATEAERLVGSTFIDEDAIWGDRVNWSQLKQQLTIDEGRISGDWFVQRSVNDVTANWLENSVHDRAIAGKAYHDAVRQLDSVANDLEESRLYRDADAVRVLSHKLRIRARMLPWHGEQAENPWPGVGMYAR
jgi:hypothetical protein